jgi:hypothetical protein
MPLTSLLLLLLFVLPLQLCLLLLVPLLWAEQPCWWPPVPLSQ